MKGVQGAKCVCLPTVKEHGVSDDVLAGMFASSRAFFQLQMDQKLQIVVNKWNRCTALFPGSCAGTCTAWVCGIYTGCCCATKMLSNTFLAKPDLLKP